MYVFIVTNMTLSEAESWYQLCECECVYVCMYIYICMYCWDFTHGEAESSCPAYIHTYKHSYIHT